jgi:acetylglutamate kinase
VTPNNSSLANQRILVVKLGGSTLGEHDTTLADVATMVQDGLRVVLVHGGGPEISRWLDVHAVPSHFVDGLRVTGPDALQVVVAVLAGVVNKQLVAELAALGVRAVGVSGVDGGMLLGEVERPELGFVGAVRSVDTGLLLALLDAGCTPVVAPMATTTTGQILNVNGDTAAGEIAAALPRSWLVFLTDVPGVLDGAGRLIERLSAETSARLRADGTLKGGMIPKIDASLRAAGAGTTPLIVDGRQAHALANAVGASPIGTLVG